MERPDRLLRQGASIEAKGIGLALAKKYHAAGNDVTIVGRDRTALDGAASALQGPKTIQADITIEAGRDAVVASAAETTVLVNNAGVQFSGEFSSCSERQIDLEVETNQLAPMHLARRFLPLLLDRGKGKISPDVIADTVWPAYLADMPEILVGKARAAAMLVRLAPELAEKIVRRS